MAHRRYRNSGQRRVKTWANLDNTQITSESPSLLSIPARSLAADPPATAGVGFTPADSASSNVTILRTHAKIHYLPKELQSGAAGVPLVIGIGFGIITTDALEAGAFPDCVGSGAEWDGWS